MDINGLNNNYNLYNNSYLKSSSKNVSTASNLNGRKEMPVVLIDRYEYYNPFTPKQNLYGADEAGVNVDKLADDFAKRLIE